MAGGIGMPGILRLLIGDLVVGQQVEVVLRVRFPDVPAGGVHTTAVLVAPRINGYAAYLRRSLP